MGVCGTGRTPQDGTPSVAYCCWRRCRRHRKPHEKTKLLTRVDGVDFQAVEAWARSEADEEGSDR